LVTVHLKGQEQELAIRKEELKEQWRVAREQNERSWRSGRSSGGLRGSCSRSS
jgi:hypothetical protein